jgi:serine/threonine protein phosphatase 1
MAARSFAVGDIHGCLGHLDALLARLAPTAEDTIIFLGDYVDRGASAAAVIDRLVRLRACCRTVFIKGITKS